MERDELIQQMQTHALFPRASDFSENATTEAIFELFDHVNVGTQQLVWQALLSGVDPQERARVIGTETLWSWIPYASPGPDFGALNRDNAVRVVVEHKRYARANPTSYANFVGRQRFDERVARSYVVPRHTLGRHTPAQCQGCEETVWHTALRNGKWAAGMPQIDYYRCTPEKWVRPLPDGNEVSLTDPTDVLWLLLDSRGRSAAEAFPGAHTATEWSTTSYDEFAVGLWDVYEQALAGKTVSDHQAADHIGRILEMIVYPR